MGERKKKMDRISRIWQGEGELRPAAEREPTAEEQEAAKQKTERLSQLRDSTDIQGNVGRHCNHPGCSVLDFLPSQCELCERFFCSAHAPLEEHGCQRPVGKCAPTCLLCQRPIHVRTNEGETVDRAMDRHIESGCRSGLAEQVRKQRNAMQRCGYGKGKKACRENCFVKFECGECGKQFCAKHRHPMDHKCKARKDSTRNDSPLHASQSVTIVHANQANSNSRAGTIAGRLTYTASCVPSSTATKQQSDYPRPLGQ